MKSACINCGEDFEDPFPNIVAAMLQTGMKDDNLLNNLPAREPYCPACSEEAARLQKTVRSMMMAATKEAEYELKRFGVRRRGLQGENRERVITGGRLESVSIYGNLKEIPWFDLKFPAVQNMGASLLKTELMKINILKTGIVRPPIVQEDPESTWGYCVLSGTYVALAAYELRMEKIPCYVFSKYDLNIRPNDILLPES